MNYYMHMRVIGLFWGVFSFATGCGEVGNLESRASLIQSVEEEPSEMDEEFSPDADAPQPISRPRLLDEGDCEHLSCNSIASKASSREIAGAVLCPDSTRFAGEYRQPSFSCDGTAQGCDDDGLWLAVPAMSCSTPVFYTICYKGRSVRAKARDTSVAGTFEASRGVQKALGIFPGTNPVVRIYDGNADVSSISACTDSCLQIERGRCGYSGPLYCNRCRANEICSQDMSNEFKCMPAPATCEGIPAGQCLQLHDGSSCGCLATEKCVQGFGSWGHCEPTSTGAGIGSVILPVIPGSGLPNVNGCFQKLAVKQACVDVGEWSCEWDEKTCTCGCTKVALSE